MNKTLALALALAAAPFAAPAAELSYTFVEGGYNKLHADVADESAEADGAYLKGSFDISGGLNAIASIKRAGDSYRVDGFHYEDRVTQSEIGLGYHQSLSDRVDFVAELAWVRIDLDSKEDGVTWLDEEGTGGRGAIGLRGQFNDRFEGEIKANYYDGNDFDGGTWTGTVGAQYKFNPTWGVAAEIEHGELIDTLDTTRYTVGVRASF
ncbi:outer membrane beta-barrel protein [Lysobacter sp. N42]|uniref:outer membrane beta-barrel protein n=1 Tax=Lysobacter sp. N42 TaxID=2545719 RepID=UPI00104D4E92|nr:outer membrane beta-barrel protein [Lysobacter sp. N42]TCZ82413.1 hypothetical protein EYQ95_23045 [Lysobacter sp. N42]